MARFIKLTNQQGKAQGVQVEQILQFTDIFPGGTQVKLLNGTELSVVESAEQILVAIKNA